MNIIVVFLAFVTLDSDLSIRNTVDPVITQTVYCDTTTVFVKDIRNVLLVLTYSSITTIIFLQIFFCNRFIRYFKLLVHSQWIWNKYSTEICDITDLLYMPYCKKWKYSRGQIWYLWKLCNLNLNLEFKLLVHTNVKCWLEDLWAQFNWDTTLWIQQPALQTVYTSED